MTSLERFRNQRGFSLIEILMALMLISILTYVTLEVVDSSINDAKFDETYQEMQAISNAIMGNPKLQEGGSRTSFGYFGDVGAMPTGIADLITIPGGYTAYTVSSANRTAHGWNGPYLEQGDAASDYTTDAWGTAYVYNAGAGTLVSYGANKVAGGTGLNQDITLTFPAAERLATVEGFVSDAGGPEESCEVEINYPNGTGGLAQSQYTCTAGAKGYFTFANIPYGVRSITVYQPTKAAPTDSVGPVVITVDKPKVHVPANQLDINP
jgi:prepilin-type N-terminal cleavage/methylation domain-containing protein